MAAPGGFPVRPNRDAFGPRPVNRFPVRDPERELDGPTIGDLTFWTVSGLAVASNRTWAVVKLVAGPGVVLDSSGEAWDPTGASVPTAARSAAGTYTVQYAATYPDKDGVAKAIDLKGVVPGLNTLSDFRITAAINADGRTVDVRVRNSGGTLADPATDEKFTLEVF